MFKTHHEAFEFLKEQSQELGYSISYKVVNCADYGVPQMRKRFICVGVKDKIVFNFPEPTHEKKGIVKKPWVTCGEAIGDFDTITKDELLQRPGGKDYDLLTGIPAGDNYLFYTENVDVRILGSNGKVGIGPSCLNFHQCCHHGLYKQVFHKTKGLFTGEIGF